MQYRNKEAEEGRGRNQVAAVWPLNLCTNEIKLTGHLNMCINAPSVCLRGAWRRPFQSIDRRVTIKINSKSFAILPLPRIICENSERNWGWDRASGMRKRNEIKPIADENYAKRDKLAPSSCHPANKQMHTSTHKHCGILSDIMKWWWRIYMRLKLNFNCHIVVACAVLLLCCATQTTQWWSMQFSPLSIVRCVYAITYSLPSQFLNLICGKAQTSVHIAYLIHTHIHIYEYAGNGMSLRIWSMKVRARMVAFCLREHTDDKIHWNIWLPVIVRWQRGKT